MNREIKFRGKRTDTKEWVYGNLLKLETDYFTDSNDTGFMWYIIPLKTNGSWSKEKLMLKFISPCFEVIPETVGQYTGLKDKNGKEIYEGDIINAESRLWQVDFKDGCFVGVDFKNVAWDELVNIGYGETEVIGNVFEDSEFLEVANGQH